MISIHHQGFQIKLTKATLADKTIFRNLMQLYLYDISEFSGENPDKHGYYDYRYLDYYWTEEGRSLGNIPILIQINDYMAGFALLNRNSLIVPRTDKTRNLEEFFIMRKWRRQQIGKVIVKEIFDMYPGVWEVRERRENVNAQHFWRNVIREYTNGGFQEIAKDDEEWRGLIQTFQNNGRL